MQEENIITPNSQLPTPNSQLPTPKALDAADAVIAPPEAAGKKEVPIVFCADENYGLYLPVVVQSIIENSSKNYHYQIIVFDCGIKREAVDALARQIRQYDNFSLHVKNIEAWLEKHKDLFKTHNYWSAATYGRFLIPEICRGYEKVIYADIDIVCNRDVAGLMEVDLGDNYIAGVLDITEECKRRLEKKHECYLEEELGLTINDVCINAGFIVFNVLVWHSQDLVNKTLELLSSKHFKLLDQDALCSLCKGKIYVLENVWNSLAYPKHYLDGLEIKFGGKDSNPIEGIVNPYLQVYEENNVVFHYNTPNKPWKDMKTDKAGLWWQYAVKTPFFGRYFADITDGILGNTSAISSSVRSYKFFGIPFWKIKEKEGQKTYHLGGLRVAKVKHWQNDACLYIGGLKCLSMQRI